MIIRETHDGCHKTVLRSLFKGFPTQHSSQIYQELRFCVFFHETPGLSMQFIFPFAMNDIFTAGKRSCGKVMFSQVSVCPQISRYLLYQVHSRGWICQGDGILTPSEWVSPGGWLCPGGHSIPPPPNQGTWDTTGYSRQAGGTHPT